MDNAPAAGLGPSWVDEGMLVRKHPPRPLLSANTEKFQADAERFEGPRPHFRLGAATDAAIYVNFTTPNRSAIPIIVEPAASNEGMQPRTSRRKMEGNNGSTRARSALATDATVWRR